MELDKWESRKRKRQRERQGKGKGYGKGQPQEPLYNSLYVCTARGDARHTQRDCPVPSSYSVSAFLVEVSCDSRKVIEQERSNSLVIDRVYGLRRKELKLQAYDKKVASNCVVLTAGWPAETTMNELKKILSSTFLGVIPFCRDKSSFTLVSVVFVFSNAKSAKKVVKSTNCTTGDLQAPCIAHIVDSKCIDAVHAGPSARLSGDMSWALGTLSDSDSSSNASSGDEDESKGKGKVRTKAKKKGKPKNKKKASKKDTHEQPPSSGSDEETEASAKNSEDEKALPRTTTEEMATDEVGNECPKHGRETRAGKARKEKLSDEEREDHRDEDKKASAKGDHTTEMIDGPRQTLAKQTNERFKVQDARTNGLQHSISETKQEVKNLAQKIDGHLVECPSQLEKMFSDFAANLIGESKGKGRGKGASAVPNSPPAI